MGIPCGRRPESKLRNQLKASGSSVPRTLMSSNVRLDFHKPGIHATDAQDKLWESWKSLSSAGLFRAFSVYVNLDCFRKCKIFVAFSDLLDHRIPF